VAERQLLPKRCCYRVLQTPHFRYGMGDFYQFPPVKGVPLWGKARDNNEDEQTGRDIWHQFTLVVILDEQMRQSEDDQCRDLLRRARNA